MRAADHREEGAFVTRRIFRILTPIMAVLVCIAFIRAVNGAGEISLYEILIDVQGFNFDFSAVHEIIDFFSSGRWNDSFVTWNSSLGGLDGFFINIRNVVSSFFKVIGSVLSVVVRGLWNILLTTLQLFADIFKLVINVLGYA